jgi:hypothetical protein
MNSMMILEWLGIIVLVGLVVFWAFKGQGATQCCSGCETCPLQKRCEQPKMKA